MIDWYELDLGWLFFGVWTTLVAVITVKAFGRDLLPNRGKQNHPINDPPKPIAPEGPR